jgi:hypothetical protein
MTSSKRRIMLKAGTAIAGATALGFPAIVRSQSERGPPPLLCE